MQGFMVTSGEYSDYSVRAIFIKLKDAEKYINDRKVEGRYTDFNEVEEIEIHEAPVNQVVIYMAQWSLKMDDISFWDFVADEGTYPEFTAQPWTVNSGIVVQGTDKERVTKVASDHRAKALAEQSGIL